MSEFNPSGEASEYAIKSHGSVYLGLDNDNQLELFQSYLKSAFLAGYQAGYTRASKLALAHLEAK